jgi:hypothetical protein
MMVTLSGGIMVVAGCKSKPATDAVAEARVVAALPGAAAAVHDAAVDPPVVDAAGDTSATAADAVFVEVQTLGPDGEIASRWRPGPGDPTLVTAGRLDAAPFQHPSPDKWYYLVGEHGNAFTVFLQGGATRRPTAETEVTTLPSGAQTTVSKVTIAHGDLGAFMEVLAIPLVGPKLSGDVKRALRGHLAALLWERGFKPVGVTCGQVSNTTSCAISAKQTILSVDLEAVFWMGYLEKPNLLVAFNAVGLADDDTTALAVELIRTTFHAGASEGKERAVAR